MRKCKNPLCEKSIDKPSKKIFCSVPCRRKYHRVHKEKTCVRFSCENTFTVTNSRRKFCSVECRKKGVEISGEVIFVPPVQNKYNHDYSFVFSSDFEDWICSPKRAWELRRKKGFVEDPK